MYSTYSDDIQNNIMRPCNIPIPHRHRNRNTMKHFLQLFRFKTVHSAWRIAVAVDSLRYASQTEHRGHVVHEGTLHSARSIYAKVLPLLRREGPVWSSHRFFWEGRRGKVEAVAKHLKDLDALSRLQHVVPRSMVKWLSNEWLLVNQLF